MVRVQAHIQLGCGVVVLIVLKLGRMQAHVRQDCACVVHGNHADSVLVEHQAHLHQHGLETLGKDANRSGLDSLRYHQVVGTHLLMLATSSESRFPRLAGPPALGSLVTTLATVPSSTRR